ncbi:MAG TPA: hypothetical protein VGO84_12090 [Burkholderiales bacterium]|jgi:hypothetical protein|nr:hypothetical protein [Burkholderiales bacterium]
MRDRQSSTVIAGIALALLAGCVTINIYFPAAAAEKAADKIIDEVWQLKNSDQPAPAPKPQAK